MSLLGIASYKLKFVEITGLISAYVVGVYIWITGGIAVFTAVLMFFVLSGIATKYKYKQKKKDNVEQEFGGSRNWRNV